MSVPSLSRFVIASCRGLIQKIAKVRPVSVHLVTRCTLLASLSLPLLSPPVRVHSPCQVLNCSTAPMLSLRFCTSGASSIQQISHYHVEESGIHGQQNTHPANVQCCCSTEAEAGFFSNICEVLRCRHLLDTEISVLISFLYPEVPRVNMLRSQSCSDPSKISPSLLCVVRCSLFIGLVACSSISIIATSEPSVL